MCAVAQLVGRPEKGHLSRGNPADVGLTTVGGMRVKKIIAASSVGLST